LLIFWIESHALLKASPRLYSSYLWPPCLVYMLGWDLANFLPRLASNSNPPNLPIFT
jgi:hypothetical protein